ERREDVGSAAIAIGAVSVITLLVRVIGAHQPMFVEGVLHAARYVDGIRRLVVGAEKVAGARGATSKAARARERVGAGATGQAARAGGCVRVVDALKCSGPSVLREIVIEHAETGAKHGLLAAAGGIRNTQARRNLLAIIARHARHNRNLQRLQGYVCIVLSLSSPRSLEEPERRLITQAVVDRQVVRNAPRILGVESESLNVLRKTAVAGGSKSACNRRHSRRWHRGRRIALRGWRSVIKRQRTGGSPAVGADRIDVAIGVERKSGELLRRCRKGAAEHRFMNKVDSELKRVAARNVAQVIADLVFVLIAQVGEKSDGSGELVVAERFEAGDGQRRHAERKLQGETKIRVARLGEVQKAGVKHQIAEPRRIESIGIAERGVPIVVMRSQSGRGQRGLLHQRIMRKVAISRSTQEPLRLRRLRRVKAQRSDIVAERDRNVSGHSDGRNTGN